MHVELTKGTEESKNSDLNPQKLLIALARGNLLSPLCRGSSTIAQTRTHFVIHQVRPMSYKLQHCSTNSFGTTPSI